jgi:hypothetical protein
MTKRGLYRSGQRTRGSSNNSLANFGDKTAKNTMQGKSEKDARLKFSYNIYISGIEK